jgi:2-polyprenyl-3-methyl-5-hydroxy-6-metoxy-1,4-benzoquinol methylase
LVSRFGLPSKQVRVGDDLRDFYGREYWLSHQTEELGLPSIAERAKSDLAGRCVYWLRTLLRFLLPPARVLELGSAHGAFVWLLRAAGYDATGLELSPWVVEFARNTFGVPMLSGPLEDQDLQNGAWDAVILNDLLEHLADPMTTLEHCARLVKPDGLLILQTPCYPAGQSYDELLAAKVPFLEMISAKLAVEHIHLFSQRSVRLLLERHGFKEVQDQPPAFVYDMYLIACRIPLRQRSEDQVAAALESTGAGRLVQATLAVAGQLEASAGQLEASRRDRHALWHELTCSRQQVAALHSMMEHSRHRLAEYGDLGSEALRFARGLRQICRSVPAATRLAKWLLRRSA